MFSNANLCLYVHDRWMEIDKLQIMSKMSTTYNPTNTLNLIHGKSLFKTTVHIPHFMHLTIGGCHLCCILCMLVGINATTLEIEANHGHHGPINLH
jgi:hypothetical protein